MPILETERQSMPRSALRYRPQQTDQSEPAPVAARRRRIAPDTVDTTANVVPDDLSLEEAEVMPRRRGPVAAPRRGTATPSWRRVRPLFWLVVGAVVLALLWWGMAQAVVFGTNALNTLRYGYPRTFQIDAIVEQDDSLSHPSHFIALNLRGTITILDFPGGDPTKERIIVLTNAVGPASDLDPVTLKFVDVNHNGKPDMLVTIGNMESILVNDQGTFRPPSPSEQQQILQQLRQMGQS